MDAQEILDTVVTHLAQQKRQAVRAIDGFCLYRAPNGCMCAIGCLLNDAEMKYALGNAGPLIGIIHRLRLFFRDHQRLLFELQGSHDHATRGVRDLRGRLREIAKRNGLDDSKVAEITEWRK